MDSTADQDLKLRRNSAELVREFQHSLPRFLRKTGTVRRLVPEKKADQLIKLVGPSLQKYTGDTIADLPPGS